MASSSKKVDYELCGVDDLNNNQMKEVEVKVDDKVYKVLLVKYENEFYATGTKCTHYSLPLINGSLYKGRIRCFAHGACFDAKTGDIEDYPGIDCLPSYKCYINKTTQKVHINTTIDELELKVRVKKAENSSSPLHRPTSAALESTKPTVARVSSAHVSNRQAETTVKPLNLKKFVIIGAGAASAALCEVLREQGYASNTTIITKEAYTAYDRPKLSKAFDVDIDKILLRNESFYKENQFNFVKNATVKKVHFDKNFVECENGQLINFDKLVIASGLEPLPHKPVPGVDFSGIFTLRSYDDSKKLVNYLNELKQLKGVSADDTVKKLNIFIVGTSFVALESATYFANKANVTVVCRRLPFSSHFGKQVAEKVVKLHESKGVKFLIDGKLDIVEFKSNDVDASKKQRLTSLVLTDGSTFDADICLVAIGSRPNTSFVQGSSIKLDKSGYIIVDNQMKTNLNNVFAVGDVTVFPLECTQLTTDATKDDIINVCHWQMAHKHGQTAALSLIERNVELKSIPFFWSLNHGKTVRFSGYNGKYDEVVFHEDPEKKNEFKFAAFYILDNRVIAACTCDFDPICAQIADLMYNNIIISKDLVLNDPVEFRKLLS